MKWLNNMTPTQKIRFYYTIGIIAVIIYLLTTT